MPVILATQEAEIRIAVQSQPRQIVLKTQSRKNPPQKKNTVGGVTWGVDSEFKLCLWCTKQKYSLFNDILHSKNFLDRISKAQEREAKVDKRDYIKLKSFCTKKEIIIRVKRWWQFIEWVKIFASYKSNRELIFRIYKGFQNLNSKKKKKSAGLTKGQ
jgi:hypothetical protein